LWGHERKRKERKSWPHLPSLLFLFLGPDPFDEFEWTGAKKREETGPNKEKKGFGPVSQHE
jgi:hypothetical protein